MNYNLGDFVINDDIFENDAKSIIENKDDLTLKDVLNQYYTNYKRQMKILYDSDIRNYVKNILIEKITKNFSYDFTFDKLIDFILKLDLDEGYAYKVTSNKKYSDNITIELKIVKHENGEKIAECNITVDEKFLLKMYYDHLKSDTFIGADYFYYKGSAYSYELKENCYAIKSSSIVNSLYFLIDQSNMLEFYILDIVEMLYWIINEANDEGIIDKIEIIKE